MLPIKEPVILAIISKESKYRPVFSAPCKDSIRNPYDDDSKTAINIDLVEIIEFL